MRKSPATPICLFVSFGLLLAAGASAQVATDTMRLVDVRPNAPIRDEGVKYWVQSLPDGGVRLGGQDDYDFVLSDLDAGGNPVGSLPINGYDNRRSRRHFQADGVGGTYVWSRASTGCRVTRVNAQREVLYTRVVEMPEPASIQGKQAKGGGLCGGFAAFSDGSTMIADLQSPLVLLNATGTEQVNVELAIPASVRTFLDNISANGEHLLVPGERYGNGLQNPATTWWVGAFDRQGQLQWQIDLPLLGLTGQVALLQDGDRTAMVMKTHQQTPARTIVQFAAFDAAGNTLLSQTAPEVLASDYQLAQFIADSGRMAAEFDGVQTIARWPDGQSLNLSRGGPIAFANGNSLWRAGKIDCVGFSGCQATIEQLDAGGELLSERTVPNLFEIAGMAGTSDGKLAVSGSERSMNPGGNIVEGFAYAAIVGDMDTQGTRLQKEATSAVYAAVQGGDSLYAWVAEEQGSVLAQYDDRGRRIAEIENSFPLTANARGVWVEGNGGIRFIAGAQDGLLVPIAPDQATKSTALAGDSLWCWIGSSQDNEADSELLRISESGELLSRRSINNPQGYQPQLIGASGDYLLRHRTSFLLQRFAADGTLIHTLPQHDEVAIADNESVLISDHFRVRRLNRQGVELWNVSIPLSPLEDRKAIWDSAIDSDIRLRALFSNQNSTMEIERWNVASGTLISRTSVNWDTAALGYRTEYRYQNSIQLDAQGELLVFARTDGNAIVRFASDQPSAVLTITPVTSQQQSWLWVNSLGDILAVAPTKSATSALRTGSFSSGLHRDGFE